MPGINSEEKQIRDEIVSVEFLNKNMFVEAGAGAGKTYIIVQRILTQLRNGYKPGSIVVITFTKKAAGELLERILNNLRDAVLKSVDPEEKMILQDALNSIDDMTISTIHSFCYKLLREQSLSALIPVGAELLDEDGLRQLQEKYFEEYLEQLDRRDWDALEQISPSTSRFPIKNHIAAIYKDICELQKDIQVVCPRTAKSPAQLEQENHMLVDGFVKELNKQITQLKPSLKNWVDLAGSGASDYFAGSILVGTEKKPGLFELLAGQDYYAILGRLHNDDKPVKSFFKKPNSKDTKDKRDFTGANEALMAWIERNLSDIRENEYQKDEEYYQLCVKHAMKARDYYWQNRPTGKLGNDDLLNKTYDMVRERPEVLNKIAGKYKYYYVDEFQDTDNIQESFIWMLASKTDDHNELRDGALFVVGDPKQSIYRFRGAQPEVFFRVRRTMEGLTNAKVYDLLSNFRSNEKIISWVNTVYGRLEQAAVNPGDTAPLLAEPDASYKPMRYTKELAQVTAVEDGGKLLSGVYRISNADRFNRDDPDNKKYGIVKRDPYTRDDCAEELAKLIRNLKDNGYLITGYDKDNDPRAKEIEYKDFLILCPSKKHMDKYLRAFVKYDIPARFDGAMDPAGTTELKAYIRIYRYLSNLRDPLARAGAIEAMGECGFWDSETELWKKGKELLDALSTKTYRMSGYGTAYELLNRFSLIVRKSEDEPLVVSQWNSVRAKLQQMVESVISVCNGTRREIAQAFEDYLQSYVEHELILAEDPDAVRFMNVHKSKGLEGNIVIFTDRGKPAPSAGSFTGGVVGQTFYPGVRNMYGGPLWTAIQGLQEESDHKFESECEFHRLEYVAATRAKQVLIFMDVIAAGNLFAATDFSYQIDKTACSLKDIVNLQVKDIKLNLKDYDYSAEDMIIDPPDGVTEMIEQRLSPSRQEKYEAAKRDSSAAKKEYAMNRPAGNIFGNMMHRSLELMMDRYLMGNENEAYAVERQHIIKVCVEQAVTEESLKNRSMDIEENNCRIFLEQILDSYYDEIEHVIKGAKKIYAELPFSYYDEDTEDAPPIWMNGTADLIIEKDDGSYVLMDYKSDSDENTNEDDFVTHLIKSYTPQLIEYKKALIRMRGASPDRIRAVLISFSQMDETGNPYSVPKIRVRYTEVDCDEQVEHLS